MLGYISKAGDQNVYTMEVYTDDMLVKSKQRPNHVTHLQEAFELLRAYDMKLNPSKCAFGVNAG